MKKNKYIDAILTVGILFLLIVSVVTPIVFGHDIKTTEKDKNYEDYTYYRFNKYYPFEASNYEKRFLMDYSPNDIGLKKLTISIEPPNTISHDPMDSAWSMQCYNLHHTSRSPYSTINTTGIEKWRFHFTGGLDDTPVVDGDGTIYCKGAYNYLDRYLYAIYPNGTEKWKYKTDGLILGSSPAIDEDGTIYVGSWDCKLYAINPNGTLKWKGGGGGSIASSPAIGEDGSIYYGDFNGNIQALYSNGTRKWIYKTGDMITSDPAIGDDGTIYIGSLDSYFYAMNPNGALKWRFKTGDRIYGHPSIADDGTIYIGSSWDSYLYALYPNGTLKWKYKNAGTPNNPSIGNDGTIYAGYVDKLVALNPNGTLKWEFYIGNDRFIGKSAPAISADGIIYFGIHLGSPGHSNGGEIIAVNPDSTEQWRKRIAYDWVDSSPSIAEDGTVYIGSYDDVCKGYLHAFGPVESNTPPQTPTISGETNGKIGEEYEYKFSAVDPDNNPVSYYVDWGDGTNSGWTREYASGEQAKIRHTYNARGEYTIKAKARDTLGEESNWATLEVSMPKNKIINPFERLLENHPYMFPILRHLMGLQQ